MFQEDNFNTDSKSDGQKSKQFILWSDLYENPPLIWEYDIENHSQISSNSRHLANYFFKCKIEQLTELKSKKIYSER